MVGNRAVFEEAVKKGHSYAWDKKWMKAIDQYELAAAEFPDDVTARSGLGFAYLQVERLREALREYRKLCELRPGDPSPVARTAEILERLGRLTDGALSYMALADLYMQEKDVRRAIDAWREAVRLQPASKEAHERLAEACEFSADTPGAAREYLTLARLCHEDGDRAQAVKHCKKVLSLDRRNTMAHALLEQVSVGLDMPVIEPSLFVHSEEPGPVHTAMQAALASLAQAILGDEDLLLDSAGSGAPGPKGEDASARRKMGINSVLGKAVDAHSQGMTQEAVTYYEKVVQMGVARVEVLFNLGVLYKEALRFSEAIDLLERCLEVPEYALASHFGVGQCHWAEGRIRDALGHFLEALKMVDLDAMGRERAADIAPMYEDMVRNYRDGSGRRKSEVLVNSIVDFFSDPDWKHKVSEARRKLDSQAEDALPTTLAEFLEVACAEEVLAVMARSQEYLQNDMPFTALEECYRAVEMAPTYLPLHLRLAEIFAHQGKVEEAVSKYAVVADAYLMRDSPHKAMAVCGRALQTAPMTISIREKLIGLLIEHDRTDDALREHLALGDSYYRLARIDMALEKYEEALLLVGRSSTPRDWRVRILHRMADLLIQRVQWKDAVSIYEKIRQLAPADEEARLRLVELRYKLGQEHVALRELDSLIVHFGKKKEFRKIIGTLRELVDSNPQDIPLRSRLGGVYMEAGKKQEAIGELDTLGELQLEAGRKSEAVETLRTIISLDPEEKEGYTQLLRELDRN